MIDIFAIQNPELFISDVEVIITERKKASRETFKTTLGVVKIPILLLDGKLPSEKYKEKIKKKVYQMCNYKENANVQNVEIKVYNAQFSSKIQYNFSFD